MKIVLLEGQPWPPLELNLVREGAKAFSNQSGNYHVDIQITFPDKTVERQGVDFDLTIRPNNNPRVKVND